MTTRKSFLSSLVGTVGVSAATISAALASEGRRLQAIPVAPSANAKTLILIFDRDRISKKEGHGLGAALFERGFDCLLLFTDHDEPFGIMDLSDLPKATIEQFRTFLREKVAV
jgi:hypothetical protein